MPYLCSALDLQRVIACGHSIGGGMVIETAAQHAELVVAAVTIAAQAFVEGRTRAGIEDARRAFSDPTALQRLARYHGEKARWVVDAWTETWLAPGFADWSLARALPRVTCPVLAIHGEKDEYGSKAHPERIADGPSRQMHMLPGTGHVIHRECPQDLAQIISGFLAEVGRGPEGEISRQIELPVR
ncbi:alpha/beta fold hydrolase [Paracoccus sp. 22332]|uniref:alpha/beta fold hydrolase n=1 Tax=Paracoccus sp. 22332 TaxID=3453913 RepID=UPI003F84B38C